jgi:Ca-activated chloride channel family protein
MSLHPLIHPAVLAIIFVPLLCVTGWLAVRSYRSRSGAGRAQGHSWSLRFAMVALVAVMGIGPSVPRTGSDTTVAGIDVFFVVDRTGSMAAEDFNGTEQRLAGVKADIVGLIEEIPNARYSIISFDSQATRQLPLTSDARAVKSWTQTLNREMTSRSRGSLVDRPIEELNRALTGSSEDRPANVRLVFFMSDGENTAKGEPKSYADLSPMVDGGAVFGYGTPEGGKMKEFDFQTDGAIDEGDYIKDGNSDALSKIDEDQLKAIASQLGIDYLHRTAPGSTAEVVAGVDAEQIADDGRRTITSYQPILWPFALALAALLAVEMWGLGRRIGQPVGVTNG